MVSANFKQEGKPRARDIRIYRLNEVNTLFKDFPRTIRSAEMPITPSEMRVVGLEGSLLGPHTFFLKEFLRQVRNLSTGRLSGLKEHLSLSY